MNKFVIISVTVGLKQNNQVIQRENKEYDVELLTNLLAAV